MADTCSKMCVQVVPSKSSFTYLILNLGLDRRLLVEILQNVATAPIRTVTVPEASKKRFIFSQAQIRSLRISTVLGYKITKLNSRVSEVTPGAILSPEDVDGADSSSAEKVLGIKFRSAKDAFIDLGNDGWRLIFSFFEC